VPSINGHAASGFHVHPPVDEGRKHRISSDVNCLSILGKQFGKYVYPVHRLDPPTSGVLLFAFDREVAAFFGNLFRYHSIKKSYFCVARGWFAEEQFEVTTPVSGKDSLTRFETIFSKELPHAVGRYETARYSIVKAMPASGRRHQIRKHLSHISHPIVGDTRYGDDDHNRFFRSKGITGLLLAAHSLEFDHPITGEHLCIASKWSKSFLSAFDLLGACPWDLASYLSTKAGDFSVNNEADTSSE